MNMTNAWDFSGMSGALSPEAARWLRAVPLLRAPPFPHARPRGRPAMRMNGDSLSNVSGLCPKALAKAIRDARVGGSFWAGAASAQDPLALPSGCSEEFDPWPLIDRAEQVLASADEELALLAAAAGKSVLDPGTRQPIAREDLLCRLCRHAAHFDYFDPFNGHRIDVFSWIAILGDWRRQIDANRRIGTVGGIAQWKREAVGRFLWPAQSAKPAQVPAGKAIAVWPSRAPRQLLERAAAGGMSVAQIEDGFIRSVGLGTHLYPPRSIIVDFQGIHYDPRQPSDLETLLNDTDFGAPLLQRAARLIETLRLSGITKYAAGGRKAIVLPRSGRRILVPGQVEDDLSVRLGGAGVAGNLDLLRRVRAREPDAFIIFKPHPDVAAGLRKGFLRKSEALRFADLVLDDGDMATLLGQVDAVHVLTSLAGFEGLIRGREVVTHGQPFYAGWGLTVDLAPAIERRRRRLTLEQLVAGALILYPRYLDPVTGLPCPAEVLVHRHSMMPRQRTGLLNRIRMLQGRITAGWGGFGKEAA